MNKTNQNLDNFLQIYRKGISAGFFSFFLVGSLYSADSSTFKSSAIASIPLIIISLVSLFRIIAGLLSIKFATNKDSFFNSQSFSIQYSILNIVNACAWSAVPILILNLKGISALQSIISLVFLVGVAAAGAVSFATVPWLAMSFILIVLWIPGLYFFSQPEWGFSFGIAAFGFGAFLVHNSREFLKYYLESVIGKSELKAQSDFLRQVLDSLPGLVSYFDENGIYRLANKRLLETLKITNEELQGKGLGFFGQDTGFIQFLNEFRSQSEKSLSKRIANTKGQYFLVFATYVTDKKDFVVLSLDVSEQVRLEQEVEAQNRQLEHSARLAELGELTASIGHEINNALFIISGSSQGLVKRLGRPEFTPELVLKTTSSIDKNVSRIQKIVASLKTLSRKTHADPLEKNDVHTIIIDALDLAEYKLLRNGITIEQKVERQDIMCRPSEISQVILNLVNNAADALEGRPDGRITIESLIIDDRIQILATDNGPGIPQSIAEQIMNPFFTTKKAGKGTGLGLSISQKIAIQHGGKLYLDQRHHEGTRFILELPKPE